jgi:type I restriction enzyme, S subunit
LSERLRHLVRLVKGPGEPEVERPYVALEHIEPWSGKLLRMTDLQSRLGGDPGVVMVERGDVLFGKLRPYLAKSLLVDRPMYASAELLAMRSVSNAHPRYLRYVVLSKPFVEWAVATSDGARMPRTNWEVVSDFSVDLPALEDQIKIADFLDDETARIDALIETKRRMIGRLEERRLAITVAGVSNPAWPRVKLTLLARLGSGHTPSRDRPDWWENPTIPWITTGDITQMRGDRLEFIDSTKLTISELGLANSAAELHPAGTVVLSRTASVGFSAIMGHPMATSQDFATWTCGSRLRPRFLLLCLRAMRSELLGRLAMGSTHKTIYMPDIEGIRVPLPALKEQEKAVSDMWSHFRPIDAAVKATEQQITLLREHRQALITAAVTGQLDVAGGRPHERSH